MKLPRLLAFVSAFILFEIHAAQLAVVTAPKAIVYADQDRESPIGFVRSGKVIQVGEVPRKRGEILPIIVSGRIAYIQIKDIALSAFGQEGGPRNPRLTEHDIDGLFEDEPDNLLENNFITVKFGQFALGDEWNELSNELSGQTASAASNVKVFFEHRPPSKSYAWEAGMGYYLQSQESLELSSLTFEGSVYWTPLKWSKVTISLQLGGILAGTFDVQTASSGQSGATSNSGMMFGYQLGTRANFFPESRFGFFLDAGFMDLAVSGLEPISLPSGQTIELTSLRGISANLGLSYKF